ncbi:MAG: phytoene desaturase family protein, partial [Spirochaetia bacterium]
MSKKIAVIGAGIAGLSAGCYARMNGFDVEVFEKHTLPGGLCTSWRRGEYTFDGCIHWLTGSAEDGAFYKFWNELGALEGKEIVDHEEFYRHEFEDGTVIRWFTDADKLEEHLLTISPKDELPIKKFCNSVRKLSGMKAPMDKPFSMMGFFGIVKMIFSMLPYGNVMKFAQHTTVGEFAEEFSDPHIKESFKTLLYDESMSLSAILFTFAGLHNKSSGYPVGGSLEFARGIERRLLDLGGIIRYKTPVSKIRVEEGAAKGVVLENGKEVSADYVISAMDLKTALEELLNGRMKDSVYEKYFNTERLFPSCIQVSLGVDMDFSEEGDYLTLSIPVRQPIAVGGKRYDTLQFKHYAFDPTLAP